MRCKLQEEALSAEILSTFFLCSGPNSTETQILSQKLTPNLVLVQCQNTFNKLALPAYIGRASIHCEPSMDAWLDVMQRLLLEKKRKFCALPAGLHQKKRWSSPKLKEFFAPNQSEDQKKGLREK